MNGNLKTAGQALLNALSNHSGLIMQAYLSGSVNPSDYSAKVIDNLIELKVLWQPESEHHLRLRPALRALLEESLKDENNRQLDTNIDALLSAIKVQAQHYKEALSLGKYHETQAHLSDITELVFRLTDALATNVRLLWSRIANEFGYVSSVDAKIRENELAQKQVTELLNQLSQFKFDELSQIAGSYRELRHLLVVTLQAAFATSTQELSLVQGKLIDLLGRFRQLKGQTRLLWGFMLHMEHQPDFVPQNYTRFATVPDLFNVSKPIIKPANADVTNVEQEQLMFTLLDGMKDKRQMIPISHRPSASSINISESETVDLIDDQLKKQAEQFFCSVISTGQTQSALSYLQQQSLDFSEEAWLYQVMGVYQGMNEEERQYIEIDTLGHHHPQFTGNFIIDDLEVGLR